MKWNIGMTPLQQMIARVRNAHAMNPDSVEHVRLMTHQGKTYAQNVTGSNHVGPVGAYRDVSPPDADDSLHPWERDLVANGEPFARPSNRVQP